MIAMKVPGMLHKLLLPVAVALAVLQGAGAAAGDAAADKVLVRYEAYWGGFHAASAMLAISEEGEGYDVALKIASEGIVGYFVDFSAAARSKGRLEAGIPRPRDFRFHSADDEEEKLTLVEFDPATGISRGREVKRQLEKRGTDEAWREAEQTPLPARFRHGVLDPLTMFPVLRRQVEWALENGQERFILPVYDGKRRFDLAVTIKGRARHNISGTNHDTIDIEAEIKPLAGFKNRSADGWKDARFAMYLDRRHLVPLRITVLDGWAATVIRAVDTCASSDGCTFVMDPEIRTALSP